MSKPSGPELRPTLALIDATAIGVGAIVGAGIFVVTGIAAGRAGSALVISLVLAGAISLLTALSFAELTAWRPREGSVYELAHELISPLAGFATGWMWMVSNTFAGAAVSLGFGHYLRTLVPAMSPQWLATTVCLGLTALNYFGVRASAILNNALVAAKLVILAMFCLVGMLHVRAANFAPFEPFRIGVLSGASFIFFAYGGFARVAVVAEEVKDPARNVPRAILSSLAISTVLYILVGLIAVGLVGAPALSRSGSPLSEAIRATGNPAAVYAVSVGGVLATASVLLTSILGVSRIAYAMARRGDLPRALSRLHPRHDTPYRSVWITGAVMAILIIAVDLDRVVAISTFALLFYYGVANVCALKLASPNRRYPRAIPALGVMSCMVLLVAILFSSPRAWIVGIVTLLAGLLYYLVRPTGTREG